MRFIATIGFGFLGLLVFMSSVWSAEESEGYTCRVQRGGVFKNFKILDEQPCKRVERGCFDIEDRHACFVNYVWPSGSKTVVEYSDRFYSRPTRINGQKAIYPNAIADHNCVLNLKTENMLCVEETGQQAIKQAPSKPVVAKPNKQQLLVAGYIIKFRQLLKAKVQRDYADRISIESMKFAKLGQMQSIFGRVIQADVTYTFRVLKNFNGCVILGGSGCAMGGDYRMGKLYRETDTVQMMKQNDKWRLFSE